MLSGHVKGLHVNGLKSNRVGFINSSASYQALFAPTLLHWFSVANSWTSLVGVEDVVVLELNEIKSMTLIITDMDGSRI